jgi:hypothetical protein
VLRDRLLYASHNCREVNCNEVTVLGKYLRVDLYISLYIEIYSEIYSENHNYICSIYIYYVYKV